MHTQTNNTRQFSLVSTLRLLFVITVLMSYWSPSQALPSFGRQTGMACSACHVGAFGPKLTDFGRNFKLGGYTTGTQDLPFSGMAVANFTHTSKDQAEPISNHDGTNDNVALQELSAFLAGKITSNVGSFAQVTYSEIDRSTSLDGVDLRYAQPLKVGDTNMILGFDFNNNPTMQDPYNTLGAWSFPYTSSDLVPSRNASPFLLGGISHQAAGLSSYVYLDNSLYLEVGGYTSLSHGLLDTLGVADEAGKLSAIAPYGRLAFNQSWGRSSGSIGLVAMQASLHPGRESGPTNKYSDFGVDATYQYIGTEQYSLTMNAAYTHENQKRNFDVFNGDISDSSHKLNNFTMDTSLYFDNAYGLTLGLFRTTGTADMDLYAPEQDAGSRTGKPDTNGYLIQADWTPYANTPRADNPLVNLRLGIQYTGYNRFNGAKNNYDGFGRDAKDNNTVMLFSWLAF